MDQVENKIEVAVRRLDFWLKINGWQGYDPYDLKSIKNVLYISRLGNKNRFYEAIREIIFEIFNQYPLAIRKIFNIEKQTNAKSMGLLSVAYMDLYHSLGEAYYLEKSRQCLTWLKENPSNYPSGLSWGYPFDWQSKELIPAGTPNGIVTTAAGEAFWNWYRFTGEKDFLTECTKVCEFLSTLPYDRISKEQICFSYTPLYINHVHNLNLFVAEFLFKTGIEVDNREWISLGKQALNYTLANQNSDGSFDYNGPPEKPQNFIDNYHTGFVLRMLHSFWKLTGEERIRHQLDRAFEHYTTNFFLDGRIPKFQPDRIYRIDIHSCAESINCFCDLGETFPEGLKIARNVANWTIENLQDPKGYFYYGILKSRFTGRIYKSRIPYMRWGQAWMLKALANLLRHPA